MGRWYLINLYTLSSFKDTHLLLPWSDLKIKYGIFWEVFPKGGRGGPLFPKLEAKIPPKRDFFEKNKIAPYGLVCKINTKIFFWIRGSQKGGVGGGPTFGKNSQIISFFSFDSVPYAVSCLHLKYLWHVHTKVLSQCRPGCGRGGGHEDQGKKHLGKKIAGHLGESAAMWSFEGFREER